MTEIILLSLAFILIGSLIYYFNFYKKGKPKVGIKRDHLLDYVKDYEVLKLYWTSISLIVMGVTILLAIGIMQWVMD